MSRNRVRPGLALPGPVDPAVGLNWRVPGWVDVLGWYVTHPPNRRLALR